MRIPIRERRHALQFNITPMIDVVFLLIIFFLVASHFVRSEHAEEIDLAEATQEEKKDPKALPLVVTIRKDRSLSVRSRDVDHAQIDQLILAGKVEQGERFEVHVRADKTVPFREIEPVMLSCARAAVTFKFAVFLKDPT
jgi:biopolymer transport protein ExbD